MLDKILNESEKLNASDIHLKEDSVPVVRVEGELIFLDKKFNKIKKKEIKNILEDLFTSEERSRFEETNNLDISYTKDNKNRYRINIYKQKRSPALALRRISQEVKTFEELNLPAETFKEILEEERGLILVTGAAGNGKSTTISAMINYINKTQKKHIITAEDPIEYIFKDKESIISQREILYDVDSYKSALKYMLRQDPDIIYIGELRDKETIDMALKASETGHLVISTLHTVNSSQAIHRIMDFYSGSKQKQVKLKLANNLKAVVSQRLLKGKDDIRVIATEIMRTTPTVREAIREIKHENTIPQLLKNGEDIYGMHTFDQSITKLYVDGKISYKVAKRAATVKKDIELFKNGITSKSTEEFYRDIL
ncbi:MAG: type IV pilus twitching motility protein PilT [Fusobacteriota bacterium]